MTNWTKRIIAVILICAVTCGLGLMMPDAADAGTEDVSITSQWETIPADQHVYEGELVDSHLGKLTFKNAKVAEPQASKYVYITRTGKKYHRKSCRYLKKSKIKITRKKAKSRGYKKCKICRP